MAVAREVPGGVTLVVRVQPRSVRQEISGFHGDALKLKVTAAPVDGAANEACIDLVARALGVKRGLVGIRVGHRTRRKTLFIEGVTLADVEEALLSLGLSN